MLLIVLGSSPENPAVQATRANVLPFGVIVSRLALAWLPDFERYL